MIVATLSPPSPVVTEEAAICRAKTGRRDAVSLARLPRAGELTAIWVPERTDSLLSASPNIQFFGDIGEFLSLRMRDIIKNTWLMLR